MSFAKQFAYSTTNFGLIGIQGVDIGRILWEAVTVAVIVFGALALFTLRGRRRETASPPAGFWFRFSLVLFTFCLLAAIEGVVLPQYSILAFWVALGFTVLGVCVVVPRLLRRYSRQFE